MTAAEGKAACPVSWCKGLAGELETHTFDPCECGCWPAGTPHCKCGGRYVYRSTRDITDSPVPP